MSLSSSSLVFDLIKTLKPVEKSYIKKQFQKNDKNLKQLFEDLDKLDVFNKVAFAEKNRDKSYITHLTRNKNYLRKKILVGLVHYNSNSIPQINQRQKLNTINVLINKGLFNQALKLLKLVLQENEQIENYTQCYEICSLIINLYINYMNCDSCNQSIKSFRQKKHFYIEQLSSIEKFTELNGTYNTLIRDQQKIEAIQQKFEKLNLKDIEDLPEDYPFYTKRLFYFYKSELARLHHNNDQTVKFLKKTIKLYDSYSQFLHNYHNTFIADVINFFNALLLNEHYDIFFKEQKRIISEIKELLSSNTQNNFSIPYFVIKYLFYQIACTKSKQYQKAYSFSIDYLQLIETQINLSDQFLAASRISIAIAKLNVQRFDEAINIIQSIQNTKFFKYQYELRLIQIIAHYRLGNDLVLDSFFTSFLYYLKKQNKPKEVKAIRILQKCMSQKKFDALQQNLFENLDSLDVKLATTSNCPPE